MLLDQIGEFDLIRRFIRTGKARKVLVGPGDDCAVIRAPRGRLFLVTTDMLIEGVHFRRDWMTPEQIGTKSMRVNLSDIAAMGGVPRFALISVGLPRKSRSTVAERLFRGIRSVARQAGVAIIGGDTNASARLVINIVLIGEASGRRVLTRKGARVSDAIYVTGTLGDAALGLKALQRKKKAGYERFIRRHLLPPDRVQLGKRLVRNRFVHSLIDLSDGLVGDLNHILEESRVGAEVWIDQIPHSKNFMRTASKLHLDPIWLKLAGGEDYELLFTAFPDQKVPKEFDGVPVTKIGKILPQREGLRLVDSQGHPYLKKVSSFTHF